MPRAAIELDISNLYSTPSFSSLDSTMLGMDLSAEKKLEETDVLTQC
jgi:hypothetical protein